MPKIFVKILFSFLVVVMLFVSQARFAQPVSAALINETWYSATPWTWYLKVYDTQSSPQSEIFGERYTAAQVQWVIYSLTFLPFNAMLGGHTEVLTCLFGGNVENCFGGVLDAFQEVIDTFQKITGVGYRPGISGLAAAISTNPISGIAYTKSLISKFNPVQPVSAQGFGFKTGASAVLKLWTVSRNISFALLTLVVIIFAFMIMFRVKISPQVVISVQTALPKLITAMILITFSYAIAGFAIDLMYVVIGIIASFIASGHLSNFSAVILYNSFVNYSAIGLLFEYWFAFVVTSLISIVSSVNPLIWIGGLLLFIFSIVAVLVMIWFTFKIIILMLKNYANIVLTIVTGPFEILLGTVAPGMGFGAWIKKLISHLAVYPLMGLMFFMAFFFLAQSINSGIVSGFPGLKNSGQTMANMFPFNPQIDLIAPTTWDPPLSTLTVNGDAILWAIVSYIIITMIPKTVDIIQGLITGRPFAYGTAIGESMTPVRWGWGQTGAPIIEGAKRNLSENVTKERAIELSNRINEKVLSRIPFLRPTGNKPPES